MNLEEKAVEAIDLILTTSEKALALITEQAPEIVQQVLLYNTAHNIMVVLFNCVLIAVSLKVIFDIKSKKPYLTKTEKPYGLEPETSYLDWVVPTFVVSVGTVLVCLIIIYCALAELFKITLSPNLYILEYFSKLL